MHNQINDIIRQLFKKNALEEVSDAELEDFIAQYPYVSAGRYLLAQKRYNSDPSSLAAEQQTAALYIHNPLWLPWLLNQNYAGAAALPATGHAAPYNGANGAYKTGITEELVTPLEETTAIGESDNGDVEPLSGSPELADEETSSDAQAFADTETSPETEISSEIWENAEAGISSEAQIPADTEITPEANADSGSETTDAAALQTDPVSDEHDRPIVFQSYHTIDYFASQGIRLQPSDLAQDKLGQQLKSFTEWLKSMKKLSVVADPAKEADPEEASLSKRVVSMAEHSLEEK
ncbi:MAG: hypothetical protein JNL51_04040, partial [Chitinophagaceae bacterium]|nr:hypothetical protein [Chitinophagaceae bacterium]